MITRPPRASSFGGKRWRPARLAAAVVLMIASFLVMREEYLGSCLRQARPEALLLILSLLFAIGFIWAVAEGLSWIAWIVMPDATIGARVAALVMGAVVYATVAFGFWVANPIGRYLGDEQAAFRTWNSGLWSVGLLDAFGFISWGCHAD